MVDKSRKTKSISNLAQFIYDRAFQANIYYDFIQQYIKYSEQNSKSLSISPCFYKYSYSAYVEACISIMLKLFNKSNRRTIYTLKDKCDKYISYLSEYGERDYISTTDLSDYLATHSSTMLVDKIKLAQSQYGTTKGVTILDVTPSEHLEIFSYRLQKLSTCIENLRRYYTIN